MNATRGLSRILVLLMLASMPSLAESADSSLADEMARVAQRRIAFGHQSVGGNVLEGLGGLVRTAGVVLEVKESADAAATPEGPGLVHALVGRNEAPLSKIEHFEKLMDGGWGTWADVAFFKLCYIDFTAETDARKLFDRYRATLDGLKARHPRVTFVHVTVPLTVTQAGFMGWLKNRLGKGAWGERENLKRHEFNELLRKTYSGEPLFDLAQAEATRPDGSLQTFERGGARYPALFPGYSNDGSHLNAQGQARVARELVRVLARIPAPAAKAP